MFSLKKIINHTKYILWIKVIFCEWNDEVPSNENGFCYKSSLVSLKIIMKDNFHKENMSNIEFFITPGHFKE